MEPCPLFLKLAANLRMLQKVAEDPETKATGRTITILPEVQPLDRETRPVQVMTPQRSSLILPDGYEHASLRGRGESLLFSSGLMPIRILSCLGWMDHRGWELARRLDGVVVVRRRHNSHLTYCFRTQSPVCSSGRAVLITPIRP